MNAFKFFVACTLLLVANAVCAKQEKMLICHVGNETGPGGETYLDDPDCVPSDLNDYFCPDAGKIDLIVVAEKSAYKHLGNVSHYWDGISDYDPIVMGANAEGTEDSDGNGVDDGCEIPDECPCWDEIDLLAVTEDTYYGVSCNVYNWGYPNFAGLQGFGDPYPSTFFAGNSSATDPVGGIPYCDGHFSDGTFDQQMYISDEEANACISQIFARCEELGHPVSAPD